MAFRDLVSLILNCTILHPSGGVQIASGPGQDFVLGGWKGPIDPLPLTNGLFLRVSMTLYREGTDQGPRVKVRSSSYQYQLDREGEQPIFRYDYFRFPRKQYPASHLQIYGTLAYAQQVDLDRVHFPTHRVSLEAVIRSLIEEFGVQSRTQPEFWRPLLAESEATFLGIHHRSLSGPDQ